ncbi:MAG: lipid-A-disaccharide synthase [bacterium]
MNSILVIAGEISGDMHAAKVVRAVQRGNPGVTFFGIGGDGLRAAGVEILYDVKDMAVLGLYEVLKRYFFFKRVFDDLVRVAAERKPDAVLLVDYPGFNLRFAEAMHARGIKVIYYVCPQVWAWHRSRIPKMAKTIDRLMVIFPFEIDVFKGTGLKVDFVGHPLVEETAKALAEPLQPLPWQGEPRVALLPGSRRQEIERILPPMWGAAALLQRKTPGASFILAAASEDIAALCRDVISNFKSRISNLDIVTGATRQILRQAKAAMVASGTATVETALMGCPMIVVYKTAAPTYFFGRMLVQVPHLGMVNLIAGREVCSEFIQGAATPEALARAMEPLLAESDMRKKMVADLAEVRSTLGSGGAAENVASIVLAETGVCS